QLVRSAPHNQLMKEAALVITHGGHGTVTRALAHGKPMLVVPHGRDQNDNATRVTARGAGLMLPAEATIEEFRAAIETLLGDPGYAAAAAELGGRVADEIARSPVAEELERIALCGCGSAKRAAA
ncbi:MAG: glycosyltransferase, partial [Sphingosinicella sp.]|uniref:glycosyltransferase n=1 Tax=Sphingosinicella sp. TaxID=1917971 RepID=UPI004037C697